MALVSLPDDDRRARRWIYAAILIIPVACEAPPPAPAPVASRDTAALAQRWRPPEGLGQAVWASAAVGTPGLGPTDARLVVWFPDVPAPRRAALLGRPTQRPLPGDALARTVLPEGSVARGAYETDAFETSQWRGTTVWAVEAGIYADLSTR